MSKENKETCTKTVQEPPELTSRQIKVIEKSFGQFKGKTVAEIAKSLGVSPRTVFYDLEKIKSSDWIDRQKKKLEAIEGLVFAGYLQNLLKGNYEPVQDYYRRFAGIFKDKVFVTEQVTQLSDEEIRQKAREYLESGAVDSEFEVVDGGTRSEVSVQGNGDKEQVTAKNVPSLGGDEEKTGALGQGTGEQGQDKRGQK